MRDDYPSECRVSESELEISTMKIPGSTRVF